MDLPSTLGPADGQVCVVFRHARGASGNIFMLKTARGNLWLRTSQGIFELVPHWHLDAASQCCLQSGPTYWQPAVKQLITKKSTEWLAGSCCIGRNNVLRRKCMHQNSLPSMCVQDASGCQEVPCSTRYCQTVCHIPHVWFCLAVSCAGSMWRATMLSLLAHVRRCIHDALQQLLENNCGSHTSFCMRTSGCVVCRTRMKVSMLFPFGRLRAS